MSRFCFWAEVTHCTSKTPLNLLFVPLPRLAHPHAYIYTCFYLAEPGVFIYLAYVTGVIFPVLFRCVF